MKLAKAACLGIFILLVAQTAFALWVPLRSAKNIPFQVTYPDSARMQVYSALESGNSRFLKGHSVNSLSELHFCGDTDALSQMLKQLANCPGATVTVSFSESDAKSDWKVEYDCRSMNFKATVNLKSASIALDRLQIPAAKGPRFEPLPWTPAKQ
jgi:hypothetical protein